MNPQLPPVQLVSQLVNSSQLHPPEKGAVHGMYFEKSDDYSKKGVYDLCGVTVLTDSNTTNLMKISNK